MEKTLLNKQFVVYLDNNTHSKLKDFAESNSISMNEIIREGIEQRIDKNKTYVSAFNAAIKKAMIVVKKNPAGKMSFPNGLSFADCVNKDLEELIKNETS